MEGYFTVRTMVSNLKPLTYKQSFTNINKPNHQNKNTSTIILSAIIDTIDYVTGIGNAIKIGTLLVNALCSLKRARRIEGAFFVQLPVYS